MKTAARLPEGLRKAYRVERVLGSGAMGCVFQAVQLSLKRRLALKVLGRNTPLDPDAVTRFRSEVEILSRLRHPNIVGVFDAGIVDGDIYLAMELVEGGTLADPMQAGPLDLPRVLGYASQVLDGLGYLHDNGIVHRDLKPENLLLADGRIKIADFGMAFVQDRQGRLTRQGLAVGTPLYMSPEQAMGKAVGPPSDLYSLGLILYEALTGDLPFERGEVARILQQKVDGMSPEEAQRYFEPVPSRVRPALMKALSRFPEERHQTAGRMHRALMGGRARTDSSTELEFTSAPDLRRTGLGPPAGDRTSPAPAPAETLVLEAQDTPSESSPSPTGSRGERQGGPPASVFRIVLGGALFFLAGTGLFFWTRRGPLPAAKRPPAPRAAIAPSADTQPPEATPSQVAVVLDCIDPLIERKLRGGVLSFGTPEGTTLMVQVSPPEPGIESHWRREDGRYRVELRGLSIHRAYEVEVELDHSSNRVLCGPFTLHQPLPAWNRISHAVDDLEMGELIEELGERRRHGTPPELLARSLGEGLGIDRILSEIRRMTPPLAEVIADDELPIGPRLYLLEELDDLFRLELACEAMGIPYETSILDHFPREFRPSRESVLDNPEVTLEVPIPGKKPVALNEEALTLVRKMLETQREPLSTHPSYPIPLPDLPPGVTVAEVGLLVSNMGPWGTLRVESEGSGRNLEGLLDPRPGPGQSPADKRWVHHTMPAMTFRGNEKRLHVRYKPLDTRRAHAATLLHRAVIRFQ